MKFHKFYKEKLAILEKQREADNSYEPIRPDETNPIIKEFFNKYWLSLNDTDFNKIIDANRSKIDEIKDIFALKSNTTYYEIYPLDAEVILDETTSLPTVTLKSNRTALRITIAAADLTLYTSKAEETKDKLNLINSNISEIKYIQSVLPTSGAPLKANLKMYINQELE